MASYRRHLAIWPELERLTGQKLGGRRISMAHVAPDDSEVIPLLELRDDFEMARADGFSAQWLEPVELEEQEPRLSPDLEGGLLTFGNAVVDSHRLTVLLAEAAQKQGATVPVGDGHRHPARGPARHRRPPGRWRHPVRRRRDRARPVDRSRPGVARLPAARRAAEGRDPPDGHARPAARLRRGRPGHLAVRAPGRPGLARLDPGAGRLRQASPARRPIRSCSATPRP